MKKQKSCFWGFLLLVSVGLLGIVIISVCNPCFDPWCESCRPKPVVSCCECPFNCCECNDEPCVVIASFEFNIDMNDPENRQKLFQVTRLDFPDSVVWESAEFRQSGSGYADKDFMFMGKARMTREDFDKVFAEITFARPFGFGGAPNHYHQRLFECPCRNQWFAVAYDPSFETNKADNPEALVHFIWFKFRFKRNTPFAPQRLIDFYEQMETMRREGTLTRQRGMELHAELHAEMQQEQAEQAQESED